MKVQLVNSSAVGMRVRAWKKVAFLGTVSLVSVLGASACSSGGLSSNTGDPAEIGSRSSELASGDWKAWSSWAFSGSTDPVVCSNMPSYFLVAALSNNDQRYYVNIADHPQMGVNGWTAFGLRTFNSSPACAFDKPYRYTAPPSSSVPQPFEFAGRASDNKIYTIHGHQDPGSGSFPPNPTWDTGTAWTALDNTVYSQGYGRPALASNGNLLVLAFMNSDAKPHAVTRPLPYSTSAGSGWSTIKNGPALPSGVTSDGIPAITYVRGPNNPVNNNPTNKFVVMVTSYSGGTPGLYWILFDGNAWGTWNQAFVPYPILSDPALEYDDQSDALSVYFKDTAGTIRHTSVHTPAEIGVYSFDTVGTPSGIGTVGAPRVAYGAGFEGGIRTAIARKDVSNLVWVEDLHRDPFYPFTESMPGSGAACLENMPGSIGFGPESFGNNAVGCPGAVTWDARACGSGSRPCTASEWIAARGTAVPTHDYWTNDNLRYNGSGTNACFVSTTVGNLCPTNQPMRVCKSGGADPEGNVCNWTDCGYGANTPDRYFGGCSGNATAGLLCCLSVL